MLPQLCSNRQHLLFTMSLQPPCFTPYHLCKIHPLHLYRLVLIHLRQAKDRWKIENNYQYPKIFMCRVSHRIFWWGGGTRNPTPKNRRETLKEQKKFRAPKVHKIFGKILVKKPKNSPFFLVKI